MSESRDIYLLGITCNIHESSAALVKNGVLIAAAEEERFTPQETRQQLSRRVDRLLPSRGRHLNAGRGLRRLLLAAVERCAQAALVARSLFPGVPGDLSGRKSLARFGRYAGEPSRRAVQVVANGIPRDVLLRRPSPGTCRKRVLRVTPRLRGHPHHGPVRRGLHHAPWPRQWQPHHAHQAVLPAAFAGHLLRGADTVPRLSRQRG